MNVNNFMKENLNIKLRKLNESFELIIDVKDLDCVVALFLVAHILIV